MVYLTKMFSEWDELIPCCMQSNGEYDENCNLSQFVVVDGQGNISPKNYTSPTLQLCANLVADYSTTALNERMLVFRCFLGKAGFLVLQSRKKCEDLQKVRISLRYFIPQRDPHWGILLFSLWGIFFVPLCFDEDLPFIPLSSPYAFIALVPLTFVFFARFCLYDWWKLWSYQTSVV